MKKWLIPVFASFMIFTSTVTTDITVDAASQSQLIATASKYKGIKYVYGGTTTSGFDCSGYTQYVFKQLGISIPRTSGGQYSQGTPVAKANLQVGDLVFFNTSGSGVSHVGIYVGSQKFIHASTSKGVVVTSINDPYYWGKRYIGARRVAKFTNGSTASKDQAEVKPAAVDFSVYASRAKVAEKLVEALNLDTSDTNSTFVDVKSGSEYAGIVTALKKEGIFTGDQNGKFNLGSPITRAEIAKVLVVAYNLQLQPGNVKKFNDVPNSNWASRYVNILASNSITVGKAAGVYGLNDNVTLKELDLFIDRASKK